MEKKDRIRLIRDKKKLTRNELSELIEVPMETISKYERGVTKAIPSSYIDKLCAKLGASYNFLSTGEGDPFGSTEIIASFSVKPNFDNSYYIITVPDNSFGKPFRALKVEAEIINQRHLECDGDLMFIDYKGKPTFKYVYALIDSYQYKLISPNPHVAEIIAEKDDVKINAKTISIRLTL